MGKASSAKKVARLAQRGKGKKVRFQGGTLFPVVIAVVVILGVLLITSARHFNKADAAGPKLGTHWHLAYGIYICDHYLDPFKDNKESSADYPLLQIHSHGDGVMHWHPGNEQAIGRTTGRAAQFHVFLNLYGVTLTDKKLSLTGAELNPAGPDVTYTADKDTCKVNGKDERLRRADFRAMGDIAGVPAAPAEAAIDEMLERLSTALTSVALPEGLTYAPEGEATVARMKALCKERLGCFE